MSYPPNDRLSLITVVNSMVLPRVWSCCGSALYKTAVRGTLEFRNSVYAWQCRVRGNADRLSWVDEAEFDYILVEIFKCRCDRETTSKIPGYIDP